MKITIAALVFLIGVGSLPTASANIQVNFRESAPKDSFVIKNIGQCELTNLTVEIDLSNSKGQLIFDTTATGAGVEVFQPFEVKTGDVTLKSAEKVADGDKSLSISIGTLPPDQSVSFTIDVDDTLTNSSLGQIRVAGSEMQGTEVRIEGNETSAMAASFSADNIATVTMAACS